MDFNRPLVSQGLRDVLRCFRFTLLIGKFVLYNLLSFLSYYFFLVLMKDSKQKAMEKQRQGQQYYRKSNFKAAIIEFSEGKLLLPQLDIYKEEMKQFYLWLAKCHLRKGHAEEVSFIKPTGRA